MPSPQTIGTENPENPYGFSKLLMEQAAYLFSADNPEMTIVGLRYFNVYGNKEFYKGPTSSMVIQLGHQILNEKAPRLFENSNKIYRDFIFIDDVVQANIDACSCKVNGSYNIGTGVPRSFQDIADILQEELRTDLGTEYFPNPYLDYQLHTQANITESKKNLSFNPKFSLEQGIKSYIPEIKKLFGESNL